MATMVENLLGSVADPECARGGGVSHILAENRGVSFTLFKKMHENSIFLPMTGGRMPGTPYAGSATGVNTPSDNPYMVPCLLIAEIKQTIKF